MRLDEQEVKRLAIYFFYDQDGIVSDYVLYMLADLKKNVSELMVVCNGILTPEGRDRLEAITPRILVRENEGFDVWAYKKGMESYGWEKIVKFDELVLLNSTIMGPLYPLSNMFNDMNKRDVDFWGITTHAKVNFDPFGKSKYGYLPLHLQSHFIAIRKHMLQSIEYRKYWDERPAISNYDEAICWHEIIFTKDFEDKGFTWQAYVDTSDMEEYVASPITMAPLELVQNRNCPIFKRRSFFHNYHEFLSLSNGNATVDLFDYIKNQTNYDVDMIWDNILRTQHLADIKNCLHLNYIIPSNVFENKKRYSSGHKIALIMHIYFVDLIGYCFNYAQSMPKACDVYITTDTEEKKDEILKAFQNLPCNQLDIRVIENRGRDVSALLISARDFIMKYDYVCFVHDKKVGQLNWEIKGDAFAYQCFENLLKNKTFVENLIGIFENNPRLGMLVPPPPGFADYYFTYGFPWGANYKVTKELADNLGLKVQMSQEKDPIAPLGTMFWFRPKALKLLFDRGWDYADFPKEPNTQDGTLLHAIERVYPFVSQQAGYYSAWVLADTFVKLEITNMNFMLGELNKKAFKIYGFNSHYGLISTMQSTIMDGSAKTNIDTALKALLAMRLRRITPGWIWKFIRKIYNSVRRG